MAMTADRNTLVRKLTKQQVEILSILFVYRFGTTDLMRNALAIRVSRRVMHKRLAVLYKTGYVVKRVQTNLSSSGNLYDQYCLTVKGVKALKLHGIGSTQALRNMRNDVHASNRFARHAIRIFGVADELHTKLECNVKIMTRSSMYGKEEWPDPLPDAHITLHDASGKLIQQFLLECIDDTKPQRIWQRRVAQLVEYIDTGGWPESDTPPALLFVCSTPRLEKLVQRWAYKAYEDQLAEDVLVATATMDTLAQEIFQARIPEEP